MPEWLELYNFYPVDRQREQVFRWLALWKLGGFWLSTQYHPLRSMEPLRQRPLVLAEAWRLNSGEFETLHRIPFPQGCPPAGRICLSDGGFAAVPGNWFVGKILDLLISRAGYLDSEEPSPEDEEYTTRAGILNAAWLQSLAEDRIGEDCVLSAPRAPSAARPQAREPERAERPSGFGEYAYRHTDLNP